MTTELTPTQPETLAAQELAAAGQAASRAAAAGIMADYLGRKTANTRRRLAGDVRIFAAYLEDCGAYAAAGELATFAELVRTWRPTSPAPNPDAWAGVTWGLVRGFVEWQLSEGYAVGAVNVRLSTVKVFCKLATQAGGQCHGTSIGLVRVKLGQRKFYTSSMLEYSYCVNTSDLFQKDPESYHAGNQPYHCGPASDAAGATVRTRPGQPADGPNAG